LIHRSFSGNGGRHVGLKGWIPCDEGNFLHVKDGGEWVVSQAHG